MPLLDGSCDRTKLRDRLEALMVEGTLMLRTDVAAVDDAGAIAGILDAEIERILAFLAHSALLVG